MQEAKSVADDCFVSSPRSFCGRWRDYPQSRRGTCRACSAARRRPCARCWPVRQRALRSIAAHEEVGKARRRSSRPQCPDGLLRYAKGFIQNYQAPRSCSLRQNISAHRPTTKQFYRHHRATMTCSWKPFQEGTHRIRIRLVLHHRTTRVQDYHNCR